MTRLYDDRAEIDRLTQQISALGQQITALNTRIDDANSRIQSALFNSSDNLGVTNLLPNSDFGFDDAGYIGATYVGAANTLAEWYQKPAANTTTVVFNTPLALSADAITNATANAVWNNTDGLLRFKGDSAIYVPLPKNVVTPGLSLYCRFVCRLDSGTPTGFERLRVTIVENDAPNVVVYQGDAPALTVTATAGAAWEFVLEGTDAAGRNTTSALSAQYAAGSTLLQWNKVEKVQQWTIFGRQVSSGNWYQLAVVNGQTLSVTINTGTRPTSNDIPLSAAQVIARTTPSQRLLAQAVSTEFTFNGSNFTDFSFRIIAPQRGTNTPPADVQMLRIDLIDSSLQYAGAADAVNPLFGVITPASVGLQMSLDRMLLATSTGKWTPAPRDLTVVGAIVVITPPFIGDPSFTRLPLDGIGSGGQYGFF